MWGILALGLALLAWVFWPRARDKFAVQFHAAQRAFARRDWRAYDRRLENARRLAQKIKQSSVQAHSLGNLELLGAQADFALGNLEESQERLLRAAECFEKANAPDREMSLGNVHRMLGEVLVDLEAWEAAEDHLRSSVNFDQACGNEAGMIFGLQRLSDLLLEENRTGEAQAVITRCVDAEHKVIVKQMQAQGKDPATGTVISMSMPDLCLANGEFERAEKLFQEKVDHWTRMVTKPDNIDVLRYQYHLARAQQEQGKRAEAVATLRAASTRAEQEFGREHPRAVRARKKLELAESTLQAAS
jgi:tetratricopeptide (TPR) repeat protein